MAQIRAWSTLLAGAVLVLAWSPAAGAASFPCGKASTPVEKAICADPEASRLDERLAVAFKGALEGLGGVGPDANEPQAALKADQRGWLAERNACGPDPGCLRRSYERRVAVLELKPDPGAPSPADPYVGRFNHRAVIHITALALRDGRLAFSVSGAEPTQGRWTCDFAGVGRVNQDGALVVGKPDAEGNGLIVERDGPTGVRIPDNPANAAASGNWCGNGGSILFRYVRTK